MNKVFFSGDGGGRESDFFSFAGICFCHITIYFFGVDIIYTFHFHLLLKRSTDLIVIFLFIHFFK